MSPSRPQRTPSGSSPADPRRLREGREWRLSVFPVQRCGRLAVRVAGAGRDGVLLLHGLAATNRYWSGHFDDVAPGGLVVAVDLLGFGRSDASGPLGLDDQVDALLRLASTLEISSLQIVGHSYGALVALRLAARAPSTTSSVTLFGPAVYRDPATASHLIGRSGPMARLGLVNGPLARVACAMACRYRTVAGSLAKRLRPDLPGPVAADAVAHSWDGYSAALGAVLRADGPALLAGPAAPITVVIGADDHVVDRTWLSTQGHVPLSMALWPGDHHLPVRLPATAARLIARSEELPFADGPRRSYVPTT